MSSVRRTPHRGVPAQSEGAVLGGQSLASDAVVESLRRERAARRRRRYFLVGAGWILVIVVVGGAWQLAASRGWVDAALTGKPTAIAAALWTGIKGPLLTVDARTTTVASAIGFSAAALLGIGSALVISQSEVVRRVLEPYFTAVNGLPRIALAPLFILWFGIGITSAIALCASLTFFVTFNNTMGGIDGVNRDHILVARVLGAPRRAVFLKVILPSAVPAIFTGLELGWVYGMIGTVGSEMIAGANGLGVALARQASLFQIDAYFATLTLLALITVIVTLMLSGLRIWLLRWQRAS